MANSFGEPDVFTWSVLNKAELTPWELDSKLNEEMKSKKEYQNYFYKERKNKNGPSTKLKLNLPTDYLDFHEGERSGFLSIPISCTLKEGLWSRSFEFIRVKWGMLTTIQQIENALIHITQHTKFKSLEGTHNRYTYNFNEADTALIKLLIDEVYNSKSKRINYSWIEPLQELICNREVKRIEKKKKKAGLKAKNANNEHKWGAPSFDELYIPQPVKLKWNPTPPIPQKDQLMQEFEESGQKAVQDGTLTAGQYIELREKLGVQLKRTIKKDPPNYLDPETRDRIKQKIVELAKRDIKLKGSPTPRGVRIGGMTKAKELITGTPGEPVPVTQGIYSNQSGRITVTNTGTISATTSNTGNTNWYTEAQKAYTTEAFQNINAYKETDPLNPRPMNESNEEKWKD